MTLTIGEFVCVQGLPLGTGKLVSLDGGMAEVSYFASPAFEEVHRVSVEVERLTVVALTAQTRVHWFDSVTGRWLVGRAEEDGRVAGHLLGVREDLYQIDLPNRESARVPLSLLRVRWDRPIDDPVAHLVARTTETPFWHAGRRDLFRSVVDQRAQSSGLTGIWSAGVELHQHQIRAVRTVLTDPIQRYLLADEVGLGKTIEAGAILRQYVLDEPRTHRALVIVPPHLVDQWLGELRTRFYLGRQLGSSVRVVAATDHSAIVAADPGLGLLIIDEAHHSAAMAFSTATTERRAYETLSQLARRTPRLLLLSATPVLHNEDGFLAMLHLLDPTAYPLTDREGFRSRVRNRQQLAETMSDLQPDAGAWFLSDALSTLESLTAGDREAAHLIERVREVIDADPADRERECAIGDLREHVSEVYRLHRRLIRHRRETVVDVLRGRTGARTLPSDDPVRRRLGELLDQWRVEASRSGSAGPDQRSLYWLLLRAALSHPAVLRELVTARRFGLEPRVGFTPAPLPESGILHCPEAFPDEQEVLDAMLAVEGTGEFAELESTLGEVRAGRRSGEKTIIFADAPAVADLVASALTAVLGGTVLRHRREIDLSAFLTSDDDVTVLVCDREAEEGLNLQTVRAKVVHLDLPLDAGRVEQRIGRIDRVGARAKATSVVFADSNAIGDAWGACLRQTVQVFDRSVASLQYILDERIQTFRAQVFDEGVDAVTTLVGSLGDPKVGLDAELRRIRTQEQLDTHGRPSEDEQERFDALEEFDADHDGLQTAFDGWVVDRLHFGCTHEPANSDVVRYRYLKDRGPRTLVAPNDFGRWCSTCVDPAAGGQGRATQRVSFNRAHALRNGAELLRLGHPFFDGIVEHARRDDRGVAQAMWRWIPGLRIPSDPWLVFGFDYVVEAADPVSDGEFSPAMRRRMDAMFPPRCETVWVDQDFESVVDDTLLAALSEPYRERARGRGRDQNLGGKRWADLVANARLGPWDDVCARAAAVGLATMKARVDLDAATTGAARLIAERLSRVRVQLTARIARQTAATAESDCAALAFEEAFAEGAVRATLTPRVTPDSVSAVFLSNSDLSEDAR